LNVVSSVACSLQGNGNPNEKEEGGVWGHHFHPFSWLFLHIFHPCLVKINTSSIIGWEVLWFWDLCPPPKVQARNVHVWKFMVLGSVKIDWDVCVLPKHFYPEFHKFESGNLSLGCSNFLTF
jgi:hypothetical protein